MPRSTLVRIEDPLGNAARKRWETATSAGFDGVELVIPDGAPDGFGADLSRLVAACTAHGPLRAISLAATSIDPNIAATEIEAWLHRAWDMGAICLNLSSPSIGSDRDRFGGHSEATNFTHTLLRQLRPTAEATGVAIALEPCGGHLESTIELRELIDVANSWAIGACVDTTRLASGGSPLDRIRTLHRRVTSVRVPGNAATPLVAITAALDEIRYEGPLIVGYAARG